MRSLHQRADLGMGRRAKMNVIIENGKQLSAIRVLVESLSAREAAREYRERTRNLNEIR